MSNGRFNRKPIKVVSASNFILFIWSKNQRRTKKKPNRNFKWIEHFYLSVESFGSWFHLHAFCPRWMYPSGSSLHTVCKQAETHFFKAFATGILDSDPGIQLNHLVCVLLSHAFISITIMRSTETSPGQSGDRTHGNKWIEFSLECFQARTIQYPHTASCLSARFAAAVSLHSQWFVHRYYFHTFRLELHIAWYSAF